MTVGNTAHVHHMVVYTCDSLNTTDPGGPCDDVSKGLSSCLEGIQLLRGVLEDRSVQNFYVTYLNYMWLKFVFNIMIMI